MDQVPGLIRKCSRFRKKVDNRIVMARPSNDSNNHGMPAAGWFLTTQWNIVRSACDMQSPNGLEAREKLCRTYWPPLYQFIRRQGYDVDSAKDLTQAFFLKLLEKEFWRRADPMKGRFRSFLLKALREFLLDERDRAKAGKRGGGMRLISLDDSVAEEKLLAQSSELTAEQQFDRRWALAVLQGAREKLKAECASAGKLDLFECVSRCSEDNEINLNYADLAAHLGMSLAAYKSAVSRMRQRYGQFVREEIAQTVTTSKEVDAEIIYLMQIIGR